MDCTVIGVPFHLQNPPWVDSLRDTGTQPKLIVIDGMDFTNALQTKLRNVSQEVRSPEFNRQVLLALHQYSSENTQIFSLTELREPQLYDECGVLIARQSLSNTDDIAQFRDIEWPHEIDVFSSLVAQSNSFTFAQLLLLHFFSFLIDEVADYWRRVVRERETLCFILVVISLRHQLKRGLLIRTRQTPLRFSRQSIHPIGTAA